MMKTGGSFFYVADMEVKPAPSAMDALVRISVSIFIRVLYSSHYMSIKSFRVNLYEFVWICVESTEKNRFNFE